MSATSIDEIRDVLVRGQNTRDDLTQRIERVTDEIDSRVNTESIGSKSDSGQWLGSADIDLLIGVASIILAIAAWQRDRSKSRRELTDGMLFLALGILGRKVESRNQ